MVRAEQKQARALLAPSGDFAQIGCEHADADARGHALPADAGDGVDHAGVIRTVSAHRYGKVCPANEEGIYSGYGEDLSEMRQRLGILDLGNDRGCSITERDMLAHGPGAVPGRPGRAGITAAGSIFAIAGKASGILAIADMRRQDTARPAIERIEDVLRRVCRHTNNDRLSGGIKGVNAGVNVPPIEWGVLGVDTDKVEVRPRQDFGNH